MASLSFISVENVVKPPQKPVVSSSRVEVEMERADAEPLPGRAEKKPMSRQPSMLTVNVPKGRGVVTSIVISFDTRNRMPPPKKLPMETIRNSFICCFSSKRIMVVNSMKKPIRRGVGQAFAY